MSTLCKKVCSGAPMNCLSVYGWNNSDSGVFKNAAFLERSKITFFRMTPFQKKNCHWRFRHVSTLHKKVFSEGQRSQFENENFRKKFIYGSFLFVFTLCKKVFTGAPTRYLFLFMAQITQLLLFWWMLLLERLKITFWEQHLSKKNTICYGSFKYVSIP